MQASVLNDKSDYLSLCYTARYIEMVGIEDRLAFVLIARYHRNSWTPTCQPKGQKLANSI